MNPTHPQPRTRGRWVIPAVIGGVVLLVCCAGAMVVAIATGDSDQAGDTGDRTTTDPADSQPTPAVETSAPQEPEPEPEPEPVGFGAGIWEVGEEIPPATYVTTAPEGGAFDSCYWARLSGFTGDFDEIIANGNLNPGARGRIEILASDTGAEFSGECRWVEVSEADPVEAGDEVGEGIWAVGDEVQPGTYTTTAPEGDVFDSCYWARLSGFTGDFDQLITNGNIDAGSRGRVEILASDAGVEFSGGCTWTRD